MTINPLILAIAVFTVAMLLSLVIGSMAAALDRSDDDINHF